MLTSVVHSDHGEELTVGIGPEEVDELREWFCYTKPLGPSVRVVATSTSGGYGGFRVVAAGNKPGPVEETGPARCWAIGVMQVMPPANTASGVDGPC